MYMEQRAGQDTQWTGIKKQNSSGESLFSANSRIHVEQVTAYMAQLIEKYIGVNDSVAYNKNDAQQHFPHLDKESGSPFHF